MILLKDGKRKKKRTMIITYQQYVVKAAKIEKKIFFDKLLLPFGKRHNKACYQKIRNNNN